VDAAERGGRELGDYLERARRRHDRAELVARADDGALFRRGDFAELSARGRADGATLDLVLQAADGRGRRGALPLKLRLLAQKLVDADAALGLLGALLTFELGDRVLKALDLCTTAASLGADAEDFHLGDDALFE
jgi:hypothetical protein